MDTDQKLPQRLYLLGGGRHHSTKNLRRANHFKRRVFDVGEVTVRPNRRTDVTVEFVVKHFDEIVEYVRTGQLIVQHSADRFVDPDELRAIRAVFLGEEAPGPIVKVADTDEPEEDVIDNPADDGTHEDPAMDPPSEPEDLPLGDGSNPAQEAFGEPEAAEPEPEPQSEPQEAVEAPPTQKEAQDPFEAEEPSMDSPSDLAEPEPAPEELPDVAEEVMEAAPPAVDEAPVDEAVEPAVEERYLPEDLDKLSKKELLSLCAERKIEVDGRRVNNAKLIDLLTSWKNG